MKKVLKEDWLYILLAVTFCFMFRIGSVFVANIVVIPFLLRHCKTLTVNKRSLLCFLLFLGTAIASIISFSDYVPFKLRNLVQFVFNIQYILLIVDFGFDDKK